MERDSGVTLKRVICLASKRPGKNTKGNFFFYFDGSDMVVTKQIQRRDLYSPREP